MKPKYLKKRIDIDKVKELIKLYELDTKCRDRDLVYFRCVLAFYLKEHFKHYSLSKIGKLFNRDHSTMIHAIKNYNDLMENINGYPDFKDVLDRVNSAIFVYGDADLSPLEFRIACCKNSKELLAIQSEILNRIN